MIERGNIRSRGRRRVTRARTLRGALRCGAQHDRPLVSRLTNAGIAADWRDWDARPCRISKLERTDGEPHPRLARRARVLPSGRRAESARPSLAIGAYDSRCNILGKS